MPAPLDLTGRRFGRLRVLAANGRVKFSREQTALLVVCNCGRQETLAQSLLARLARVLMVSAPGMRDLWQQGPLG